MLRVFIGYDPRQPLAYNVLQHSIVRHASAPVAITPLILSQLPLKRRGLTEFTYSRFLVPYLCDYQGLAVFMDADMVVKGDVSELHMCGDSGLPVHVMKAQPKFEWASVMVFNCDKCRVLTPEFIESDQDIFGLGWANGDVGEIPDEWNHCVGYQDPKQAKLYHYTQGLPCWPETQGLAEDQAWQSESALIAKTVTWKELMGKSVHAKPVLDRLMRRLAA
jgi:lipopolysaccharide biosynthesis glycosyltransferase